MSSAANMWGPVAGGIAIAASGGALPSATDQSYDVTFGTYQHSASIEASQVKAGGTSKMEEALLTAKLEAVEARTDSKFSQLLGELKVISSNVSGLNSQIADLKSEVREVRIATASVKWNIMAAGLAIGALILGLFAYGQQMMQLAAGLVGLKH